MLINNTLQNLSFVLEGVKKVSYQDRPIPTIKDPHDVQVHVKFTGVCGSDVCPKYTRTLSLEDPQKINKNETLPNQITHRSITGNTAPSDPLS